MKNPAILALLALFLSSCVTEVFSMPKSWDWGNKPRYFMMRGLPDNMMIIQKASEMDVSLHLQWLHMVLSDI